MQMIRGLERGAKMIVIDPKETDMAKKADIFIQPPVGYNIPLINAMINHIIQNDLFDKDFIEKHAHGFEYVKYAVSDFTPQRVEKETGIPASLVIEAAEMYAKAGAAAICYTMGITQFIDGTSNVFSLSNLAVITGNLGKKGGGVNPLRGQNNVQGACDMAALPNVLPNGPVTNDAVRAHVESIWGQKISAKPGYPLTKVPHEIDEGKIKFLYVFGENPVMSDPWTDHFVESAAKLDTMVVQDIFLTETAQQADVVLPAASWGEKEGTFLNTSRRLQKITKAVEPAEGVEADWKVICNIANRLGLNGFDYYKAEEIWDEVRKVNPAFFGGLSYARIVKEDGISWPCPDENHPGTPVLYKGGISMLPDGKFKLVPVIYAEDKNDRAALEKKMIEHLNIPSDYPVGSGALSERVNEVYPCLFTTGRKVYHYHTGTMTRECKPLEMGADIMGPAIEVSEDIAKARGLEEGCYGLVENKRGKIAAKVIINPDLHHGTIFTTFHYAEADGNALANAEDTDPLSGMNPLKMTIAAIRKISEEEYLKVRDEADIYMHPSEQYRTKRR
ncbi:MAG: putative molibdopterin-dependent oxidoreductase YjgC [Sulfurimonas sp.]|jgi:predicted molibdopterin-dependent oxidoreductase YjgC